MLSRARVRQLSIKERDTALLLIDAECLAIAVAALDDVDLLRAPQRLRGLRTRTPPKRPVHADVRMIREEVFGEVAPGHARDTGDQDPHAAPTIAITVPDSVVGRASVLSRMPSA